MEQLPDSVTAYKRTPEFNEATVPQGLLKNHSTKSGVWGVITVLSGELEYTICDGGVEILSPSCYGIVEPEVIHHIRPLGSVSFYVEFYK
jgi:tellurite resistance-related uncharacterized protein